MNIKTCTKCGIKREFNKFNIDKSRKSCLDNWCKTCRKIYAKKYYKSNKEAYTNRHKKYYLNNREMDAERSKKYNTNNKEKVAERKKEWRRKNKERCREYQKKYRQKNFERKRNNHYMLKYGISLDKYNELFKNQNGLCAICGGIERVWCWGKLRPLAVDHNHETGEIRGLLCCNCNRALGLLGDNTKTIKNMLDYLGEK